MSGKLGSAHLLRHMVGMYRQNAVALLLTASILFVPLGLVSALADDIQRTDVGSLSDLALAAVVGAAIVQLVASLLGSVFYSGAVSSIVLDPRPSGDALRGLLRSLPWWRLIVIDVLLVAGVALGIVLLIVPGLVFFTYFAVAAPIVELEGRGVRDGLRRSRELVRGHFWAVFRVLIPLLIVIELLAELAIAASAALFGDSLAGDWLGGALTNVLMNPLYGVAVVVLMVELIRARGESLPRQSPGSP